jgi:hypothetical protein
LEAGQVTIFLKQKSPKEKFFWLSNNFCETENELLRKRIADLEELNQFLREKK